MKHLMKLKVIVAVCMTVWTSYCIEAEGSRIVTTVTHTTLINHRTISDYDSSGGGMRKSVTDDQQNELKTEQGLDVDAVKKEQCTIIDSLGLFQEASISVPSSTAPSNFFVNILSYENLASEEPPSCLVIDSAGPSSSHRDLTECGQVVHRKWQSRKQNKNVDLLHFTFNSQDENFSLSSGLESSGGNRKVCVGWSHVGEDFNLTLVQKREYISEHSDSILSADQKNQLQSVVSVTETTEVAPPLLRSLKHNDNEINADEVNLSADDSGRSFAVDLTFVQMTDFLSDPDDSFPGKKTSLPIFSAYSLLADSLATTASNTADVSRTVSVNSLVDSAANASLCILTSTDQQMSSSLSVTSGECNFRSAMKTCTLFLRSDSCLNASANTCVVLLPPNQTIVMDPVFGEVMISDDSLCGSLSIEGSGCVILPSSSSPLSMRLLNVDLSVPSDRWFSLSIDNVVIMNFGSSSVEGGAVQLNNLKSNYLSSVTNVIFRSNVGRNGGALAISNSETVVLGGNVFEGNTAQGDAGGLFIGSDCENINITDCSFTYNRALGKINTKSGTAGLGGGAMINTRNSLISLHNCSFFRNVAQRAAGLGVFDSNNHISLTEVSFSNNTAERLGGGIYAVTDNLYFTLTRCNFLGNVGKTDTGGLRVYTGNYYMTLLQCVFSDNSANGERGSAFGGGIYLYSNNYYFTLQGCYFSGNSVSSAGGEAYGGGVFIFSGNWLMVIKDSYFYDNSADMGGALFLNAGNYYAELLNVTFRENVARDDGGGVALISGNYYFTTEQSSFIGNSAGTRGGGIYAALQNNDFNFLKSDVTGNSAVSGGGGVYMGESHNRVLFDNVDISDNTAVEAAGGAFFSRFSSEVTLSGCQIKNNSARTVGGLLILVDDMLITSSVFEHNVALGDYGALLVQSSKSLEVTSSNFSHNVAPGKCGAMSVSQTESVTVDLSLFSSNSAGTGGAVCVAEECIAVSVSGVIFQRNVASLSAGALHVSNDVNVFIEAVLFTDNTALTGHGSAIYISSSRVFLESSSFSGNKAPLGGGTVFWKSASGMLEPSGLSGSEADNYFSLSNTAQYGSWYATEARYIVSKNDVSSLDVVDYSTHIAASFTVLIQDWYNQTVLSDSSSSVSASVSTSLTSDCYGEEGFIGGLTRMTLLNGSAKFDFLEPVCAPSYNLSLDVSSSLTSVASLPFQYSFRSCVAGEYYAERICNPCKEGSYSFVDPSTLSLSDLSSDVCQQCPAGAQTCFGDQIIVNTGHWRISEDSSRIFECPLGESSCLGGNLTGESSCGEGYSGALCAVCRDGYHYLDTYQTCEPCSGAGSLFDSFLVIIICLVVTMLVAIFIYLKIKSIVDRLHISNLNELIAYFMISLNYLNRNRYDREKDKYISMIQMQVNSLIYRFRIYFVLYQVVVALPFVLSVDISSAYDSIVSALSFINFSVTDSSVSSCSFGSKFDFINKLFFQTIYPFAVLAFIFIICGLHLTLKKKDQSLLSSQESNNWNIESRKIISKYIYVALFFFDLILPYTSAIIFSTFSCKNIDPDLMEAGDDSFMTADYSVSCQSERYLFAKSWATTMIFVYPIGVPACFAVILYRSRDDIKYRYTPLGEEKKETDRAIRLAAISSLYEVYQPEYWYWEVFEILYRLLLTGFLVLIGQGLSAQIFFGIFVAFAYVKCHEIFTPYEDKQLNIFKTITLWQIFYIFIASLVSFTDILNTNDWRFETVVFLVIFGNIPLEFTIGYLIPQLSIDKREQQLSFRENFRDRSRTRSEDDVL